VNELASPEPEYDSRFHGWDERASVRRPRPAVAWAQSPEPLLFPPELCPVAAHPLVVERGPATVRFLLAQRLFQYLTFTVELESRAVLPVVADLARGRCGIELPDQMRRDAFRIVTDEAWHATFSNDLIDQVRTETGVVARLPADPQFVHRLVELRRGLSAESSHARKLTFATVSETLISSILAGLPNDQRLPAPVRAAVRDHAEDEGRHHAYFRDILGRLWLALSRRQRRELGVRIPFMITAFLEPDLRADKVALRAAGLTAGEADQVLDEAYPPDVVTASMRGAARSLVRYLEDVGAFSEVAVADAFVAAKLREP
jgi:hypothetical protein